MRRLMFSIGIVVSLAVSAVDFSPTALATPNAAMDVKSFTFLDGKAHQTNFKLNAKFPSNPSLTHYSTAIDAAWKRCTQGGEWDHFGAEKAHRIVHQSLHWWVNDQRRRAILLAIRYDSSDEFGYTGPTAMSSTPTWSNTMTSMFQK